MPRATDIRTVAAALYFLPIQTRLPLKFGSETLTHVTCARVRATVIDSAGRKADGWGETPLSVQWVWPSSVPYAERENALKQFCTELTDLWASLQSPGHPLELGCDFLETVLPGMVKGFNQIRRRGKEPMPWLAALVCCSAFDLAIHDAYGMLHNRPSWSTYSGEFLNRDLAYYLKPAQQSEVSFHRKYPDNFLVSPSDLQRKLIAWHLVGGLDPVEAAQLTGAEPHDGYPVLLEDWIRRDGLKCLKVKLRGNDSAWDYSRLVAVGTIASRNKVHWLSADFNCTVTDPKYVNDLLDRIRDEHPALYGMILYVEQPFPYDLEQNPIDVHSISARKPLFLDESAHDWRLIRHGRELGWSGVALKTCKTQTGAILSACWAKAHGMALMVQDLTNPMLAQIPHALLAAHVKTIMGVETNSMQFYPEASKPETAIHSGLYSRRDGTIDLSSIQGPGFGYRVGEIKRDLPPPSAECK